MGYRLMAGITHDKVLTGSDGTNPNRAQPSDWNADHVLPDPLDLTGDLNVDTIDESTTDAGVTVEGVLLKDSAINFGDEDLDTFDTGVWTPELDFQGTGDLSVAYGTQSGTYVRVGSVVTVWARIVTTTFTHSTASGGLELTGLPFTVGEDAAGSLAMGEYNWGGEWLTPIAAVGSTKFDFYGSDSGAATGKLGVNQFTSGDTMSFYLTATYTV